MAKQMRFDDRLATILDQAARGLPNRASAWSQLADILAQEHRNFTVEAQNAALSSLSDWQSDVPVARRQSTANALANPRLPCGLIKLFALDRPSIAAPALSAAMLTESEWLSLIPSLPPASRALLRERRDLPRQAGQLLASYGASDFALEPAVIVPDVRAPHPKTTQISDLVAKIEAFRRNQTQHIAPIPETPPKPAMFRFETTSDGMINWIEGVAREAILGLSIAEMAAPAGCGVDGIAAGAFRQRSAFQDANLLIPGIGDAAGKWLISAKPAFDGASGRLSGYRGIARRPHPQHGLFGRKADEVMSALPPDSARQFVHELRTPLNAISGFSEMISQQLLGPVAQSYRNRALKIGDQAAKLAIVFDDLESDARLTSGSFDIDATEVADARTLLIDTITGYETVIDEHGIVFRLALANEGPSVAIDPRSLERLFDRLVSLVIGSATHAEVITLSLSVVGPEVRIEIDRPLALKPVSDRDLLDPANEKINHASPTPALGIAFTLRLINKLAKAFGGRLNITSQNFTLILPTAQDSAIKTKESS